MVYKQGLRRKYLKTAIRGLSVRSRPSKPSAKLLPQVSAFALFVLICGAQPCFGQRFENPRLSADERKVAFDYCNPQCHFLVHDLETDVSNIFAVPSDEAWVTPSFEPLSKELVFVVARTLGESQIATIGVDGSGLQIWTRSRNVKRSPSFSPDGRRVVYSVREEHTGKRGKFFRSDAYLLELPEGLERRITDLGVSELKAPNFLPNGTHFTFSTVGVAIPRSGKAVDLERLNPGRNLFVFPLQGTQELKPIIEKPFVAVGPQALRTGEIAVLARVNELDRLPGPYIYDVFIVDKRGARRLTELRMSASSFGIAPSGRVIVFSTPYRDGQQEKSRLTLWKAGQARPRDLQVKAIEVRQVTY
jgi:hypothetical protein